KINNKGVDEIAKDVKALGHNPEMVKYYYDQAYWYGQDGYCSREADPGKGHFHLDIGFTAPRPGYNINLPDWTREGHWEGHPIGTGDSVLKGSPNAKIFTYDAADPESPVNPDLPDIYNDGFNVAIADMMGKILQGKAEVTTANMSLGWVYSVLASIKDARTD